MRLTEAQRRVLARAASESGCSPFDAREANTIERLRLRGHLRLSMYGDRYFATESGRLAFTNDRNP
jgi:hypothetical protein